METAPLLFFIGIGIIIYIAIVHAIIKSAAKSGTEMQEYHLKVISRLLIKRMLKEGYSKEEIVNMIDGDEDQFWKSIPGKETKQ